MIYNNIIKEELYLLVEKLENTESPDANKIMLEVLDKLCAIVLDDKDNANANMQERLDNLCRIFKLSVSETNSVHKVRYDANSHKELLPEKIYHDRKTLSDLISNVFSHPELFINKSEKVGRTECDEKRKKQDDDDNCIRCRVLRHNDEYITVQTEDEKGGNELHVAYDAVAGGDEYGYLRQILRKGMQLNLLDISRSDDKIMAGEIVVEHDFLVDISSLAACFEDYGHHPLLYTLNRLKERPNTYHIILGNFASMALDDIINSPQFSLNETIKKNFREKAIEYATCDGFNPSEFMRDAKLQTNNIIQITLSLFKTYDKSKVLLEPSFVCERLGVQGRVDMMTSDKRMLVEQKSGKNRYIELNTQNSKGEQYVTKHYVQLLLYYGVLKYNFKLTGKEPEVMLLYSKYPMPGGLIRTRHLETELREAIGFRNLVVAQEYAMTADGFGSAIDDITPETLNVSCMSSFFYENYLLPELKKVTDPLAALPPLERAYLCRMMTFVLKEQLLTKTGELAGPSCSVADMWRMTPEEKLDAGSIYMGLRLVSLEKNASSGSYDLLTLDVPDCGDDFSPNFRRGDMVYVYAYPEGEQPDVRRSILFKGVMVRIEASRVSVCLSNALQNPDVLARRSGDGRPLHYAIEHSGSDVGSAATMRALFDFVTSSPDRRELLLSQREPRRDMSVRLTKSYGDYFDDLLLRAMQARDYFLLVGPPGTGKTSTAMRYMVEEQLAADNQSSVLLTAYTNRAVDEICSMLCDAGIDFMRIGNEYSCDERFRPYLVGNTVEKNPRLVELRRLLVENRVYVGTVTTLMSRPYIFALKHFALAVVDEAGQITEPGLVGLLAAHRPKNRNELAIDRFILIGDYKQLPAVVQQSVEESAVTEPCLNEAGIRNCRDSLFERLIRNERRAGREDFIGLLRRQGRMHPVIAAYAGAMFYADERLEPVPCPHQKESLPGYQEEPADELDEALKDERVIFIPSEKTDEGGRSEKVNASEARIVADLVVRIRRLAGSSFNCDRTIGIIVPYRNQITMIRREMERRGLDCAADICIDTVERFQGSQREVIICSLTVNNDAQLDFLTSNCFEENGRTIDRKLNVTLTRARRQMILTGNPEILGHNGVYADLMERIRRNGRYMEWHVG